MRLAEENALPWWQALGQTARAGGAAPGREAEDCDWLYWVAGPGSPGRANIWVSSGAEYRGPAYLPSEPNSWGFSRCSGGLPHRQPCLWSIAC